MARRHSIAPWSKPKAVYREPPSWIGMPAVQPPPPPPPLEDLAPAEEPVAPPIILSILPTPPSMSPVFTSTRETELEEENARLRAELAELFEATAGMEARVAAAAEPEVVRLAIRVAERVVGAELTTRPELVAEWVREGLAALPRKQPVVVAVASDLGEVLAEIPGLVVDDTLAPGTCELREGARIVPIAAAARLATIAAHVEPQ